MKPNEVVHRATFTYKSVDKRGNIYLEDPHNHLVQFEFWRFIKVSTNETLKSRLVEEKQRGSEEYMELMQNFQQAFNELQGADNHPKRLGAKENS